MHKIQGLTPKVRGCLEYNCVCLCDVEEFNDQVIPKYYKDWNNVEL